MNILKIFLLSISFLMAVIAGACIRGGLLFPALLAIAACGTFFVFFIDEHNEEFTAPKSPPSADDTAKK